MTNETIGMIISLFGMLAIILSFQMRKKSTLLIAQTIGAGTFMLSYVFSGGGIGVILNGLGLVRNFLLMWLDGKEGKGVYVSVVGLCISYVLGYLLYILVFGADSSTANKCWSILPVLGMTIGTIAFSMTNMRRVRLVKLGDSACWLGYNSYIGLGALGGILCEIFSVCSIGIALFRFRERGKEKEKTE